MQQSDKRRQRHWWRGTIVAAFLAGGFMAGSWIIDRVVAETRVTAERNMLRVAQAAVEAVRQRIDRTLEAATTLHVVARRIRIDRMADPDGPPQLLERHLVEVIRAERLDVLQLAIIDAAGMLVWSTVPGFTPVDLSDREHFRVHRDGRREPFVSAPLIGRASGRWSIQFTQALQDDSGGFIGVSVVSMDPLAISSDLSALDFGPGVVVTLLRDDGTILATSVNAADSVGGVVDDRRRRLLTRDAAGSASTENALDGRQRITAWQRMHHWSLVVACGLDQAPIDEAASRLRRILTIVLLSLLGCSGVGAQLVFGWLDRNRERAEAKLAEVAAREAADLLQAMPGAAYRGTITADGGYERLFTSSGMKLVEGSVSEATADFPCTGTGEVAVDVRAAFFREVFQGAEAIREFRIRSPTAGWAWVREHCRVVRRSPSDGSAEVVGLIIDITEERKIKAQAVASAKLATLGEMATGVAHELNQPCASIALAADVASFELDRGSAQDVVSARRRLDDIAEQTTRLREVIDHFQIFSRMPDGRAGAVSVADAMAGALKISTGMLKAAGIGIVVDLPADLPKVHAELVPLEQVLINLLVNARDAMRGATDLPKRIEISATRDGAGGQVVVTVRDHGNGLPPGAADRLFEPFFTTKPPGEGTGLGLAIAYGTIRGFGGAIDIGNHAEGGAIVTLRLKVQEIDLSDRGDPTATDLFKVS